GRAGLLPCGFDQLLRAAGLRGNAAQPGQQTGHRRTDGGLGGAAIKAERGRDTPDHIGRQDLHNERDQIDSHGFLLSITAPAPNRSIRPWGPQRRMFQSALSLRPLSLRSGFVPRIDAKGAPDRRHCCEPACSNSSALCNQWPAIWSIMFLCSSRLARAAHRRHCAAKSRYSLGETSAERTIDLCPEWSV